MAKIIEMIPTLARRGGAEVLLVDLICEMVSKSDNEFHIICLYEGINEEFAKKISNTKNVKIHFFNKKVGIDFITAKKIKKLINKIKPDIVHLHLSCLATYFLAFPFSNKKMKIIQTIHNVPSKDSRGFNRILRKFFCKYRNLQLVGISNIISSQTVSMFPFLKKEQITTIYNGVNLRQETTDYSDYSKRKYDLICIASFQTSKNHKMLLDAIEILKKDFKKEIKVAFLGQGAKYEETTIIAKEKQIYANIDFLGNQNDVYPFLNNSKIFVLTSLYEGNPISLLEAMNCGIPSIVPEVGGIPDVIKNSYNGFMFKVNDCKEFISRVINLLKDEELAIRLGTNASNDVIKYKIDGCADSYLKLFEEINNGKK